VFTYLLTYNYKRQFETLNLTFYFHNVTGCKVHFSQRGKKVPCGSASAPAEEQWSLLALLQADDSSCPDSPQPFTQQTTNSTTGINPPQTLWGIQVQPFQYFLSLFLPPSSTWVVGCWRGYLSGARCRLAYGPVDVTATHCLLLQ